MPTKKTITTILAFVLLVGGIAAGTLLVREPQKIGEEAAPLTGLSFNPGSSSTVRGQNFTTNARMATSTNSVTGVDIEITYNPAVIQLTQLTPTSALSAFTSPSTGSVIRNEINNQTGNARFIAYTTDRSLGLIGTFDILSISGSTSATATAGNYQLSYGSLTAIAAVNEGQNVVLNKTSYTLNLTLPTASPSPTPSPSPSPSPTPSPSPIPTASPSPTPSPTPYAEIVCLPQTLQTVNVNQNVSFSVGDTGRNPSLILWTATGGTPNNGSGLLFTTKYSQGGNYTVSVTDGGPVTTCSVRVNTPTPTPSPIVYPNWDIDQNGLINIIDIGLVIDKYGITNSSAGRADVDRNGIVNIVDIGIIIDHYQ